MHASECKRYADACARLADEVPPPHRTFLLDMAARWLSAAQELEREERQHSGDADSQASGM